MFECGASHVGASDLSVAAGEAVTDLEALDRPTAVEPVNSDRRPLVIGLVALALEALGPLHMLAVHREL